MRIPEIQAELNRLSVELNIPRLAELAVELRRRKAYRAPNSSVRMSPILAKQIRDFARQNPDMTQSDMAVLFNVNPGRVSEALRGKRK